MNKWMNEWMNDWNEFIMEALLDFKHWTVVTDGLYYDYVKIKLLNLSTNIQAFFLNIMMFPR